jgi:exodeoxyribonuclease VII large subunit
MRNTHIYTVNEITSYIKDLVEEDAHLQDVWVRGEISNFKSPSRHLYFALKDEESLLSCIMFQDKAYALKFTLENGLEVIARGNIGIYKPQGRYQLYVEEIFPVGRGYLYLAFEQLKQELEKKGYFRPEHKVPLPYLPQRIGIVTSSKGAAIRDILTILDKRFQNLEILLAPCRVQGEQAAREIAQAIQNLNDYGKIDVIIIGRGGGSFEDLFPFNEEIVAEAIYNSHIPIISAVGHEIDVTISDLVADERTPTPSAAAERVVPKKNDLINSLENYRQKLFHFMNTYLSSLHSDLETIKASSIFRQPFRRVQDLKQRTDDFRRRTVSCLVHASKLEKTRFSSLIQTLQQISPQKKLKGIKEKLEQEKKKLIDLEESELEKKKEKVLSSKERLSSLSPSSILKRGYSICLSHPEGKVIREYKQTRKGQRIKVKLYKGGIYSRIYQIEKE